MGKKRKYTVTDIIRLEIESMEKANRALSAIENALAVWKAEGEAAPEYGPEIKKLEHLHNVISNWQKNMLINKKESIEKRVARLREFSDIFYAYSKW